jgi:hypothetical protein
MRLAHIIIVADTTTKGRSRSFAVSIMRVAGVNETNAVNRILDTQGAIEKIIAAVERGAIAIISTHVVRDELAATPILIYEVAFLPPMRHCQSRFCRCGDSF